MWELLAILSRSNLFGASWYKVGIELVLFVMALSMVGRVFWKRLKGYRTLLKGENIVSPVGKVVVITGCDSGFGKATAQRLHEEGFVVFAGCLNAKQAAESSEFSKRITGKSSTFHLLQMDITKQDQVDSTAEEVKNWLEGNADHQLWALINNSGVMQPMVPFEFLSLETCKGVFEVNYFGALRVTKAFLPILRQHRGSRVIVTSSIAAEVAPVAFNMQSYCATKSALLAAFDILRSEVNKFGIHVCAVCPDFYRTEIANPDINIKKFDAELETVAPGIVESYGGEAYCERLRGGIKGCVSMAREDLSPVVDAFFKAVSTLNPNRRYFPVHKQSHRIKLMYKFLPSRVDTICAKNHQ